MAPYVCMYVRILFHLLKWGQVQQKVGEKMLGNLKREM